jgi:hypothetical protein
MIFAAAAAALQLRPAAGAAGAAGACQPPKCAVLLSQMGLETRAASRQAGRQAGTSLIWYAVAAAVVQSPDQASPSSRFYSQGAVLLHLPVQQHDACLPCRGARNIHTRGAANGSCPHCMSATAARASGPACRPPARLPGLHQSCPRLVARRCSPSHASPLRVPADFEC